MDTVYQYILHLQVIIHFCRFALWLGRGNSHNSVRAHPDPSTGSRAPSEIPEHRARVLHASDARRRRVLYWTHADPSPQLARHSALLRVPIAPGDSVRERRLACAIADQLVTPPALARRPLPQRSISGRSSERRSVARVQRARLPRALPLLESVATAAA